MQRHPHVDMVELDAFVGRIEAVEGQEGGGDVVGFPNQAALHLKAGKAKRAVQRLRPTVQVIENAFQFDGGLPASSNSVMMFNSPVEPENVRCGGNGFSDEAIHCRGVSSTLSPNLESAPSTQGSNIPIGPLTSALLPFSKRTGTTLATKIKAASQMSLPTNCASMPKGSSPRASVSTRDCRFTVVALPSAVALSSVRLTPHHSTGTRAPSIEPARPCCPR